MHLSVLHIVKIILIIVIFYKIRDRPVSGMALALNNVNMDSIEVLMKAIAQNPATGKITPNVRGQWNFAEGQPQFQSVITTDGGTFTVEADMSRKLGGWGNRPGPLHYCLYGIASCYAFVFAANAAREGVALTKLSVEVEGHIDFSKVFGLTENPIVEGMRLNVTVGSPADVETLEAVARLTEETCPALYCLSHPIDVSTKLVKT
jgi:uncharacterized OsmC-like protein